MLRKASEIMGYTILANDGEIGHVQDFLFDVDQFEDPQWNTRYMMVDTGFWIFGRKVLIAPEALGTPDWDHKLMPVNLTKDQIKDSPEFEPDAAITHTYERELRDYYGWPAYWGAPPATPISNVSNLPDGRMSARAEAHSQFVGGRQGVPEEVAVAMETSERSYLYSVEELRRFSAQTAEGDIGTVKDVFIDDYNWTIRYLLIDTSDWFTAGRQVLIAPQWIEGINFDRSTIDMGMTKEQIENSPEYQSEGPINRDYEGELYDYYGHRTYW